MAYLGTVLTMRLGSVAVVQPVRYTLLLFAALAGFVAFGEVPDGWTIAGSALIVGAGISAIRLRESSSRAPRQAARAAPATKEARAWTQLEAAGADASMPPATAPSVPKPAVYGNATGLADA